MGVGHEHAARSAETQVIVRVIAVDDQADGDWILEPLDPSMLPFEEGDFAGAGSSVLVYTGDTAVFTATHDGGSNFIVTALADRSRERLINEIGAYSGRVPVPGLALIWITADGNWSFTKS